MPLTSASETTSSPHALCQLLHLDNLGGVNTLKDQLGDAVALLDFVVGLGVVEQKYLDLATVIGVNHTSASVDEVLRGKAGSRCDATV